MTKNTLKKTRVALRVLGIGWQARPRAVLGFYFGAVLEVVAFLVSIYATARLAGLLAQFISGGGDTSGIWFWLWVDIISGAAMGVAFWVMSWAKRLLYFRTVAWLTTRYQAALCDMDVQDFYDDKIRNQLNKVQGAYIWQVPGLNEATLDLTYGLLRFGATAFVVSQITWWLIPLIALFLLPTLAINNRLAKVQWFVWDAKGDERHIFWGLSNITRNAKNQMELRSSQAKNYVLGRINEMNAKFYHKQENEFSKPNGWLGPAKIIEAGGTAAGAIIVLKQFLAGSISLERYFFLTGALLRIGGALNNIFGTLSRMQEPLLLAEDYFAIIDRKPKIADVANPVPLLQTNVPEIVFDNVDFTYPGNLNIFLNRQRVLIKLLEQRGQLAVPGVDGDFLQVLAVD